MAKLHYRESASEEDKKHFTPYLSEDEELILATGFGKTHLRSCFAIGMFWPGGILFILGVALHFVLGLDLSLSLFIGLIGSIIIGFLKSLLTYHANRYLLTTRRVIIKRGFFAVQLTSALYDKITHIEVDQSFLDKIMMHHGTIRISTAGMNKNEIDLDFVDYPIEFKNLLERLINRERSQFGLRTGPVTTIEGELV